MQRISFIHLAILLEGLLVLGAFAWSALREIPIYWHPTVFSMAIALGVVGALLALQPPLYYLMKKYPERFSGTRHWVDTILGPFCSSLTLRDAAVVSLAAGVGEELFFRGVLLPEFGILISSALFSLVHFGTAAKTYPLLVLVYFFISLLFSVQYEISGDILGPIVAHSLYDFCAIVLLARRYRRQHEPAL